MAVKQSKRYRECLKAQPPGAVSVAEAVKVVKSFKPTKFDSSVELVMHMGIDTKQADQLLRGSISLPHGVGASKKVIAFCDGENIEKAKAAGAVEAVPTNSSRRSRRAGWTSTWPWPPRT